MMNRSPLLLTIAATSLGFVIIQLDVTIVNVALVRIGANLGATIAGLQWMIDAYTLAFATLLMSGGALGDRSGGRRVLVAGFVVFALASAMCGLARSGAELVAARAVQGLGAALIVPNSLALLNDACADNAAVRARALGLWNAAGGLAVAAGPVVGGLLLAVSGWRGIFLVNLPICALGIWLARFIKETPPHAPKTSIDIPGQLCAIVAVLAMTASIIECGASGWRQPVVLAGAAAALAAGLVLIVIERRTPNPMLPLHLFRRPSFSAATCVGFLNNFAYYGLVFILGFYFQTVRHYSTIQTGLAFVPLTGTVTVSNLLGSRLAAKSGPRLPMVLGFAIATFAYAALHGIGADTPYVRMLVPLAAIPFGLGLAIPAMTAALLTSVERRRAGVASAIFTTVRQIGGAVGVAVFGAIVAAGGTAGMAGIHSVFFVCACSSALACAVSAIGIRQGGSLAREALSAASEE
jgi:DHA2 family methylenomycin A resistance protein-like MFS transporter